jgi:hypothetical protein
VDVPIFLPLESDLDALIANTRDKLSVFLQLLKESKLTINRTKTVLETVFPTMQLHCLPNQTTVSKL